ncbi:hypothetical protein [Citricoccus sp. GCM10030269]|uniref:hypothetical protein n=1 Tax=Citricoccus sp. GCM10030269 TaxID=3273388 RepID=UPI003611AD5D
MTASARFSGSVSGVLTVLSGITVDITGVLEDAVVSGAGTVRVSGLIAEVFRRGDGDLLASVGSVLAPMDPDGPWHILRDDGTWVDLENLVFPVVDAQGGMSADQNWYPVPTV